MKKLLLALTLFTAFTSKGQIISTIAGNGFLGYSGDGLPATTANLNTPYDICSDASGNFYIPDGGNHVIRKVNAAGIISTFAGTGISGFSGDGGPATAAQMATPTCAFMDGSGNMYIADELNNRVRKIDASGTITTIAGTGAPGFGGDGGPATAALLSYPYAVIKDATGNIYIADRSNNRIRKINPSGIIRTIAGTGTPAFGGDGGPATAADMNQPVSLCLSTTTGNLYFTDWNNRRVRKITPSGTISTIAGNGTITYGDGVPAVTAGLSNPYGVAVDCHENVYVAENTGLRIRQVNTAGIIHTVGGNGTSGYTGDGGPATAAQLYFPFGLFIDVQGNLIISDQGNNCIRKIVNPSPPATITGPSAVCAGSTMTLTTSVAGGTWGIVTGHASVSGSGVVSGITGGVDTVTYISCSATMSRFPVTVDIAPVPGSISGPDTVCMAATIALTDPVAGGTWRSSATGTATISVAGVVTGVTAGVTTISYSVTNSCGTAVAIHPVTVMALPVAAPIAGPTIICGDYIITLTDATPGGVWSISNPHAAMPAPGRLRGVTPGIDTVYYTVTNGCGSAIAMHVDTIMVLPFVATITGATSLCKDSSIILADTSAGGIWSSTSTSVATVGSLGRITAVSAGVDTIKYSLTNACGTVSSILVITVIACDTAVTDSSAGIHAFTSGSGGMRVYPNPNTGVFRIIGSISTSGDQTVSVAIMNMPGKLVYTDQFKAEHGKIDKQIDVSNSLPAGMYLLTVRSANDYKTLRISIGQ
jgi:hypothetical protein